MLPSDLDDWLTEEGDRVVHLGEREDLSEIDRLIYDVWLLDSEQRNGGMSQYFENHDLDAWRDLRSSAADALPAVAGLAAEVDPVVRDAADPYEAALDADLGAAYKRHSTAIVRQLRDLVSRTRGGADA